MQHAAQGTYSTIQVCLAIFSSSHKCVTEDNTVADTYLESPSSAGGGEPPSPSPDGSGSEPPSPSPDGSGSGAGGGGASSSGDGSPPSSPPSSCSHHQLSHGSGSWHHQLSHG